MRYRALLSYAQDFASFLTFNLEGHLFEKIERIILYGPAARGAATKKSKVDLFIEARSHSAEMERAARKIMKTFFGSPKVAGYWKPLGIENPFRCMGGRALDWKDIYASIVREGVVLYEKFRPGIVKGRELILFSWENVKPESERVMLNRKLYGYKRNGKEHEGLLSHYNAKRVSKGSALVPAEHRDVFEKLFLSYRTTTTKYRLFEEA